MSIDLVTLLGQGVVSGNSTLAFSPDDDFKRTLAIGDVIKGRVLRHYEQGRYLVDFSGQQKVVDSTTPLTTNEILYGRVTGIGEKVELERVRVYDSTNRAPATMQSLADEHGVAAATDRGQLISQLLEDYQVKLNDQQLELLESKAANARHPESMLLAGLLLAKQGLTLHPDLLQIAYWHLLPQRRNGLFDIEADALVLATGKGALGSESPARERVIEQTVLLLMAQMRKTYESFRHQDEAGDVELPPESPALMTGPRYAEHPDGANTAGGERVPDPGWLLLNVQHEGSVAHKVDTLPIIIDDRLIEIDIAAFEQKDSQAGDERTRHRQVVFALDTETLGHLEINTQLAGKHVRVSVRTSDSASTDRIAIHSGVLVDRLTEFGWEVDQIDYGTILGERAGIVPRTVVEHLISRDSLSRLI